MTLRARLVAAGCLVLIVLGAVVVVLPRQIEASQIEQVDSRLKEMVPIALALTTRGFPPPTASAAHDRGSAGLSDLYVATFGDDDRQEFAAPSGEKTRAPERPSQAIPVSTGLRPQPVTVGSARGQGSWRAVLLKLPDATEVLVATPLDQVNAAARSTTIAVMVAAGVVLLVMAATGWWLFRLGLRPIADVTDVADAIAAGHRGRRAEVHAPHTEAGRLAGAFNVMLDEHDKSEERLRQFVADSSHELRTPITAIGGIADLWRSGGLHDAAIHDAMRRIGMENARMTALVDDLLLLASVEAGPERAHQEVDLGEIAHAAAIEAAATHPSRPVTVDGTSEVPVTGDPDQLRRVVVNLVTNALVHTDDHAAVRVAVWRRGSDALLSVSDSGAGMSSTDVEHAFDRFWRADSARTRRGSGLGLPLVRSIVERLGGRVALESAPGRGTTVRVVLPVGTAHIEETRIPS